MLGGVSDGCDNWNTGISGHGTIQGLRLFLSGEEKSSCWFSSNIESFVVFYFSWTSAQSSMVLARIDSGPSPIVDCDGT